MTFDPNELMEPVGGFATPISDEAQMEYADALRTIEGLRAELAQRGRQIDAVRHALALDVRSSVRVAAAVEAVRAAGGQEKPNEPPAETEARAAARLVLNQRNGTWKTTDAQADAVIDAYLGIRDPWVERYPAAPVGGQTEGKCAAQCSRDAGHDGHHTNMPNPNFVSVWLDPVGGQAELSDENREDRTAEHDLRENRLRAYFGNADPSPDQAGAEIAYRRGWHDAIDSAAALAAVEHTSAYSREAIWFALAGVLLNTHNYPRRARWLLEGTDQTQMLDRATDVVMGVLSAAAAVSGDPQ